MRFVVGALACMAVAESLSALAPIRQPRRQPRARPQPRALPTAPRRRAHAGSRYPRRSRHARKPPGVAAHRHRPPEEKRLLAGATGCKCATAEKVFCRREEVSVHVSKGRELQAAAQQLKRTPRPGPRRPRNACSGKNLGHPPDRSWRRGSGRIWRPVELRWRSRRRQPRPHLLLDLARASVRQQVRARVVLALADAATLVGVPGA